MACYICGYPSVLKCHDCGKSICGRHHNYDNGKCTICHDKQFAKPVVPVEVETKPAFAPETKPMRAKKGRK